MSDASYYHKMKHNAEFRSKRSKVSKEWYAKNKERCYWVQVRRLYGITKQQFDSLLEEQNNCCCVCLKRIPRNVMTIDHCHKTGRVRGVLHKGCNTFLGLAKDSPTILRRAADYLEAHNG